PSELYWYTENVRQNLQEKFKDVSFSRAFNEKQIRLIGGDDWQNDLPDLDYLGSWFRESVLVQLSAILNEIKQIPSEEIQLILRVILSDILREVSLQEPADLRIRRRKFPPENVPAIWLYLDTMKSKIDTILKARKYLS